MDLPPESQKYTFGDLMSWDNSDRYELIDGKTYALATPSDRHQDVLGNLHGLLWSYLRGKACQVRFAPYAVRLFEQDTDFPENSDIVLQPDLCIICDTDRIDPKGYRGAPSMVAEILSPSTASYDMGTKADRYEEAGVKEYWIIDPMLETIRVFLLKDGTFRRSGTYHRGDTISVNVLKDCQINLDDVFS